MLTKVITASTSASTSASASAAPTVPVPVPNWVFYQPPANAVVPVPVPTHRRFVPVKRAREDSPFAPRKKARISSAPITPRSRSKPYRRRRIKSKTAAYLLAKFGRKVFDRSFAAGMDAAIANVMEMQAAAARVELPMKRPRKVSDTVCDPPRKKARISSIEESSLTAESSESESESESEPLGSYWTVVPDRRGDMMSVRRSHRLNRSRS